MLNIPPSEAFPYALMIVIGVMVTSHTWFLIILPRLKAKQDALRARGITDVHTNPFKK